MRRVGPAIVKLSALVVVLVTLSSCMTTSINHGYSVKRGQFEVGAAGQYVNDTANSGVYFQARPFLKYGYDDSFSVALTSGFYDYNSKAVNSVGGSAQFTNYFGDSSVSLGVGIDFYFNLDYSLNFDIDSPSTSDDKLHYGISPDISLAYCFTTGDIQPFVGVKASGALASIYTGVDWRIGFIKPSLCVGVYRPYLSLFSASSITYLVEPAISLEFW